MNSLPSLKICIIGSNGFLSNSIANYANAKGWSLSILGRTQVQTIKCDLFTKVDLMQDCLNYEVMLASDIIIYAAGAGIQSNLKESKEQIFKLNTFVPTTICNKLVELGYKGTFVSFGSVFEMGESDRNTPFTEEDILSSLCPAPSDYVVSKRMLSRYIVSYKHEFRHWHFIIPTIYGESENPKRLIPYTVNSLKNGENPKFTSGEQIRQYLYVNEVPKMIEVAITKNLDSGVYNIQGKETVSVRELVAMVHSFFGAEVAEGCFGSADRTDVRMKYLALDGRKLRDAIGFVPQMDIKSVIAKY